MPARIFRTTSSSVRACEPTAVRSTSSSVNRADESIPAAFAVVEIAAGDPWRAAVIGANLGGDTDTIGAIAAGMAGACAGYSRLPQDRVRELVGIDLDEVRDLADRLVARRKILASRGFKGATA